MSLIKKITKKETSQFYGAPAQPVTIKGSGSTSECSASKATLFKSFFNSVFSPKRDENADILTISKILDTRLSTLLSYIHVLVNLDVNKSVNPDSIPLRILSD